MKSNLGPNWFLTHVPAPGSLRPYYGMAHGGTEGAQESFEMSREPPTPMQRLEAQHEAAKREQRRLERSFR